MSYTRIRNGIRCEAVYMVCEKDEYELPIFVSSSLKEVADFTGLTENGLRSNLYQKSSFIGKEKRWKLERVYLPIEIRRRNADWKG